MIIQSPSNANASRQPPPTQSTQLRQSYQQIQSPTGRTPVTNIGTAYSPRAAAQVGAKPKRGVSLADQQQMTQEGQILAYNQG